MGVPPYIVHQTFQYGGVKGKRHRLREAMLWRDPPAYYSDGEFLHAELAVLPAPPDFEQLPEFNMSMFHLQNMELQLLQVRCSDALQTVDLVRFRFHPEPGKGQAGPRCGLHNHTTY